MEPKSICCVFLPFALYNQATYPIEGFADAN